jgi:hypothetical protein
MRVSDDRYSRDRTRLDLALRFIQHAARTRTIRTWTGLTDDRIRKLYRSYFQHPGRASAQRPRGRSPQQAAFFVRSPRLQHEASMLASACDLLGGLARTLTGVERPSVAQGVLLCQSYEAVRMLVPASRISFEHFVFLAAALARGDELRLAECSACGALLVTERIQLVAPRCVFCVADAPACSAVSKPRLGLRRGNASALIE